MGDQQASTVKLITPDYRRRAGLVLLWIAAAGLLGVVAMIWRYQALDNWVARHEFISAFPGIFTIGLFICFLASFFSSLILRENRWELTAGVLFFLLLSGGLILLLPIACFFTLCLGGFLLWGLWSRQTRIKYGLIATVLSFSLAYLITPSIDDENVRSKVSRVRSDQRTLTNALETYYADHHAYPAWTETLEEKAMWRSPVGLPSFRRYAPGGPATLTTPVAYLEFIFIDPFARDNESQTFAYWVAPNGANWILWSPGPDMHFDLDRVRLEQTFNLDHAAWFRALIPYAYDPSNGSVSAGDVWRTSE